MRISTTIATALGALALASSASGQMERVKVSGTSFVLEPSGRPFAPWGFNYDRDARGREIEDYWAHEWSTVEQDFREMKALGANVARIHLQFGRFLPEPDRPDQANLERLERLLALAERTGLYLDLTGLGCYHKPAVPRWYDALDEAGRWRAQRRFWSEIAARCSKSPAVFCYDLMNEPLVPGGKQEAGDWLGKGPGFGGKYYVQKISLDLAGRTRGEVARRWVVALRDAIREHDKRTPITVGLVDWSLDRPGLFSGITPQIVADELDFVCVHLYPQAGKVKEALETLKQFALAKPVVIEETFPLACSIEEFQRFVEGSRPTAAGLIGFYWGQTPEELTRATSIGDAITRAWLEYFKNTTPARTEAPEPGRPLLHFTPPRNFINDPNGLVFLDGEYHLFYQHNPQGNVWGHMSWGHAVSRDLVLWRHLPVALHEEAGIMIFSGSAVFDERNTSGLGRPGSPPLVAVYTGDGRGKQTQNLASSLDRGRTWTKYAGNPVLDIGSNSFRDPKVFWHAPSGRWIMATVLADERKVRLWSSKDLKAWEKQSDFGPAGSTQGVWECPDLFEAPVEGKGARESRYILKVDVNDGAPAGGSGGQYFVGRFDGKEFHPEGRTADSPPLWIDHGKDFYASQTFSRAPGDRPIWLAWMNNWKYANAIPTTPWRGAMTIARLVSLRETAAGLRIRQTPVAALKEMRGPRHQLGARAIAVGETRLDDEGIAGQALEILAEFERGQAGEVGLKVRVGKGQETVIGVDYRAGTVYVDRTHSGNVGFSPDFPGRHSGRLSAGAIDKPIRLHVFVDATSVEVFAEDGLVVVTDQIFPSPSSLGVSLFATAAPAGLKTLEAWELRAGASQTKMGLTRGGDVP